MTADTNDTKQNNACETFYEYKKARGNWTLAQTELLMLYRFILLSPKCENYTKPKIGSG